MLKADGLAAGKGVFVCSSSAEARAALPTLFKELKADKVVAEQFLPGIEASFIVATNGRDIVPLVPSHDYKRIFDKDAGPNTGGMGSVTPTSHLPEGKEGWVVENVIAPVLKELERRGSPFVGFLYAGLMISPQGEINVLEFNVRLGDPETQSILRRLDSDLVELLLGLLDNKTAIARWNDQHAICVVLAAHGYPASARLGDRITGIDFANSLPSVTVFHAGTKIQDSALVTAGGRVLNVTATGRTAEEARAAVYRAVDMIQFPGRQARRDIGC